MGRRGRGSRGKGRRGGAAGESKAAEEGATVAGAGAGTSGDTRAESPPPIDPARRRIASDGTEFLDGVEGRDVEDAFERVLAARAAGDEAAELLATVALFEAHRFVRQALPKEQPREAHLFRVQGYSLNVNVFRKWLKGAGRRYFKIAGGVSDDGLYTVSGMPRGFHVVTAVSVTTTATTTFMFRGIKKFTGLTSGDEDEASNSSKDLSRFLFGGKTMADVTAFWRTDKSNGENAKVGARVIDDVRYLMSGSKNTCVVWPAEVPSTEFYPITGESIPGNWIAHLVSTWYLGLTASSQAAFFSDMVAYGTLMGEVNRADAEHLVPIPETFIEFYSVLTRSDGQSVHPAHALEFFERHSLPHVTMVPFERLVLESVIERVRKDATSEGSVLYLLDRDANVVGLVKVKSNHYVIVRRLREKMKWLLNPLRKDLSINDLDVDALCVRISKGMRELTHVPGCAVHWEAWAATTSGFARWWAAKWERARGDDAARTALLNAFDNKFATTYGEYLAEAGKALFK